MIYLDHNATTPVLPEVARGMWPFLTERWGNPSSAYRFGAEVQQAIDKARDQVAELLGAQPEDVIFTSGATEANNTAIRAALSGSERRRHIVTSQAEHSSVLGACEALEAEGVEITYLGVNEEGHIDPAELEHAIRLDTALVSVMWANNETGVISPVERIGEICRQRNVPFHCDAVQAVGKIPIEFGSAGIDYLSVSGHKIGAPKGVGALIVRSGAPYAPFIHGGRQQHGRRGGTESVPLVVAIGMAASIARTTIVDWERIALLRDQIEVRILNAIPQAYLNGSARRLPNTVNFGITGVDSDGLVAYFDHHDICVSTGSACMANAITPSHVILAMTSDHDRANEALRVSLGRTTTKEEIDRFVRVLLSYPEISRSASESAGPGQSSAGIQRTKS